jgi:hypothetical protein
MAEKLSSKEPFDTKLALRLASSGLSLAGILGTVSCSGEKDAQPTPPRPEQTTTTQKNLCDIITPEMAADFLKAKPEEIEGACTTNPDDRVDIRKVWTVTQGTDKEVTMSALVTDQTNILNSGWSFDRLYEQAPTDQQCQINTERCFITDTSLITEIGGKALVNTLGVETNISPRKLQNEVAGDLLINFTKDIAKELDEKPRTTDSETPKSVSAPVATPSESYPQTRGSSEQCSFYIDDDPTCRSSNAMIELGFVSYGDTSDCRFKADVSYGDGNREEYTLSGNTGGHSKLGNHQYEKEGTYKIDVDVTTTSGQCNEHDGSFTFELAPPATLATCEYKFDEDRGRSYLYSMLPTGELTKKDGSLAGNFEYDPDNAENNVYIDKAGVEWVLMSSLKSSYHQPEGWQVWNPLHEKGPYKKFVTRPDSTGGSFEAVVMPDGITPGTPYSRMKRKDHTYSDNYLLYGRGMPTYNLADASRSNMFHYLLDMNPHDNSPKDLTDAGRNDERYVQPVRLVDPMQGDWQTYRERLRALGDRIARGYRLAKDNKTVVTRSGQSYPVDPDLVHFAKEYSECEDAGIWKKE